MQLRALKNVFFWIERKSDEVVFYVGENNPNPIVNTIDGEDLIHLRAGDYIEFVNIQAGDNPYQTLADNHPDLLVMEPDAPSD